MTTRMPPPHGPTHRAALAVALALLLGATAAFVPAPAHAGEPPPVPVHASLDVLKPWLASKDWSVRSIAAFELRKRVESGTVYLATLLLRRETHPYAAAGALGALRGRPRRELVMEGGPALVAALLRFSEHEHPIVSAYAREILLVMPPVKLGTNLALYKGWWKRGAEALAREQRALLEEYARSAKTTAELTGKTTSSVAPDEKRKDFYERLESMGRDGLELCVVMDDTGSMRSVLSTAKKGARELITRLRSYVPRFRAAFLTYKDAAYFRIGLTQNAEQLVKAFDKPAASGGMDYEEGVDKGIKLAISKTEVAWSRKAHRVVVVVGDAPPHERDVPGLLRYLREQKDDVLFEHPVVVHMVSTSKLPVLHFQRIARAGGGRHMTLEDTGDLVDTLVLLTFGGQDGERVGAWMDEIDRLRAAEPEKRGR